MKTLIDLFWVKYSQIQQAVTGGETSLIDVLDREIEPLLKAIESERAKTVADARLQFQFLLDLLKKEADDCSNVMRHSNVLSDLAERYFVESETGNLMVRYPGIAPERTALLPKVRADEGLLNEAILDSLPDRVCVVTPDYRYLYANVLHAQHVHQTPLSLIGRTILEFAGLQFFEDNLKPRLDRCFGGETVDTTYAREIGGRTIVIRSRMTPCRTSTGQIIGAIIVYQELANRRRAIAA
ncbi:PAS domain-containing protein [Rhizobiaceae bacterium CRRU44]|uniref:PAS domain-containing protein n=1 Tax=Ferranicluibacter rubi TaxID=2715133 RepID=A0AA43ZL81_9HYPH|nr:PAS domain-containing protein [Ferranicluibacter rubi]